MKSDIVESEDDFHIGDRLNFPIQANRNQTLHCFTKANKYLPGSEYFTAAGCVS